MPQSFRKNFYKIRSQKLHQSSLWRWLAALGCFMGTLDGGVFPPVSWVHANEVKVHEVQTPSGLKAWLVEDHTLPILSMSFSFRAGSAYDPSHKFGLASFVARMLMEGAGTLDQKAFSEKLQDYAINLDFDANIDHLYGSLRTTTRHQKKAYELLKLVLKAPRFDSALIEKNKLIFKASFLNLQKDQEYLAHQECMKRLFGKHPYSHLPSGRLEDSQTFNQADLKAYVKNNLTRDGLIVGVCGDISPKELALVLDQIFGSLPYHRSQPELETPHPTFDGQTTLIRTDHPQSFVKFVHPSHRFTDPHFMEMVILNHILGGGSLTSRLFTKVREEKGLAYSISTSLFSYEKIGVLAGNFATQNARVKESLNLIRSEWQRIQQNGISAAELRDAKTYLIGSFPLNFVSTTSIARLLSGFQEAEFPLSYINARKAKIESITLQKVNQFAKKFFKPDQLCFAIVGNPLHMEVDSGRSSLPEGSVHKKDVEQERKPSQALPPPKELSSSSEKEEKSLPLQKERSSSERSQHSYKPNTQRKSMS